MKLEDLLVKIEQAQADIKAAEAGFERILEEVDKMRGASGCMLMLMLLPQMWMSSYTTLVVDKVIPPMSEADQQESIRIFQTAQKVLEKKLQAFPGFGRLIIEATNRVGKKMLDGLVDLPEDVEPAESPPPPPGGFVH